MLGFSSPQQVCTWSGGWEAAVDSQLNAVRVTDSSGLRTVVRLAWSGTSLSSNILIMAGVEGGKNQRLCRVEVDAFDSFPPSEELALREIFDSLPRK